MKNTFMKHIIYIICTCGLLFFACEETLLTPQERAEKDEKAILEYIANNNIQGAERTANGVYYAFTEKPSSLGSFPTSQSVVTITYTGELLTGEEFDSRDSVQLGLTNTIRGWQEGIPNFKKTWKGWVIVPSQLAYGEFPPGGSIIPRHAVLVFDIRLLEFE